MAPIERMLRALTEELLSIVREHEAQLGTIEPATLLNSRRALLDVLEILSRTCAKQPAAVVPAEWRDLAPVEAAKRILWLEQRPLKASEINEQLAARGWCGRS
jgi:hypothetical protein